jgi:dTDP-4-dehydrorhamnose 3,5-epimerase
MQLLPTPIHGCFVVALRRFEDERGSFEELYNRQRYRAQDLPIQDDWQQVNCSRSRRNVVRGIHVAPFAKLVTCLRGRVFDVVVDTRPDSPTFRRWHAEELSDDNARQVYVPPGCGHGFMALDEDNLVVYLQTATYDPTVERTVHWRDPGLAIPWPPAERYVVSARDEQGPGLR